MKKNISIPESYGIFQQDLSKQYLALKFMGEVKTINEAQAMCKVFNETDAEVLKGKHTYIFVCNKLKNE